MFVELKIGCVLLSAFTSEIIPDIDKCLGKVQNWPFESGALPWDKGINAIDWKLKYEPWANAGCLIYIVPL